VILFGETLYESADKARAIAAEEGLVFVHPYDDPKIMAGQGTCGLEILEDHPDLDQIVVPIGGGGLISGITIAAKGLKPSIEIVGVEAALYPSFQNAIAHEDRPIGGATLAEGIAVKTVGQLPLPIVRDLVPNIVLVEEPMIERAVNAYATL
ncbi:pyridoxal-phosphate dependent enzyme, partial [Corallococcus exiguus]|nr:pyridoxal-phosphate dependent enzyme [Corallococcus exiguus]